MDDRGSDYEVSIHPAMQQTTVRVARQRPPRLHVMVASVPNSARPRRKKMPTDDVPHKLVRLLLELIASGELPELAVGGAWLKLFYLLQPRPALGPVALEADMCGLAVASLRMVGPASDWVVSLVSSLVACACERSCVSGDSDDKSARCWGCRASHAATQARRTL